MNINDYTPESLLSLLQERDEQARIEAKRASEIGKSVMQTICAFANEPGLGGGYLLLGIEEPNHEHDNFHVVGVKDADRLLNDIQINCRGQFEAPIPVQGDVVILDGKKVIRVFVPELEVAAKPCTFIGKFDSKNKRKTGVWRRGLNGDYECAHQHELAPLLLAKSGMNFEQVVLPDAEWDDIDPTAIALYRTLRAKVRPQSEELQASDSDMVRALNLVVKQDGQWVPNIAGLLLMGKPLSLRRLLPAVRVDYVRISGTKWREDSEHGIVTTLDSRDCLLRQIPKLEATVVDDLPHHFRLEEGETQRRDVPIIPYKVIREAVVNTVMHRDYQVHQPTLIVRYSNRIEMRNAGYSLKPDMMLGEMGSQLRNPIVASVLYDLNFAETKGTGVGRMRRLLSEAGLTPPVFASEVIKNQVVSTYLLHQLLGEEQLAWLTQFKSLQLTPDEAKALILAKETGAVDNAALRAISDLDTLEASNVLGKLYRQHGVLVQGGAGSATYYELVEHLLDSNTGDLGSNAGDLEANTGHLGSNTGDFDQLPEQLFEMINVLSPRARKDKIRSIVLWLCAIHPMKADNLANLLGRKVKALKESHLNILRDEKGFIEYLHPEVINHPSQAYKTTQKGKEWLQQLGIGFEGSRD
jgi:ATP-dependent DNA helicase RecG